MDIALAAWMYIPATRSLATQNTINGPQHGSITLLALYHISISYRKPLEKLDFAAKRRIVQGLVKRIEIHSEKVRVEFVVSKPAGEEENDNFFSSSYGVTGRD